MKRWPLIIRLCFLVTCTCIGFHGQGQDSVFILEPSDVSENGILRLPPIDQWKFREGHDPKWADPDLDDSDWIYPDSALVAGLSTGEDGRFDAWFRFRFKFAEGFPDHPYFLSSYNTAAQEIFLDGEQVIAFGRIGSDTTPFRMNIGQFQYLSLEEGRAYTLAVHFHDQTGPLTRTFRNSSLLSWNSFLAFNTAQRVANYQLQYQPRKEQAQVEFLFSFLLALLFWLTWILVRRENHLLYIAVFQTLLAVLAMISWFDLIELSSAYLNRDWPGLAFLLDNLAKAGLTGTAPLLFSSLILSTPPRWAKGYLFLSVGIFLPAFLILSALKLDAYAFMIPVFAVFSSAAISLYLIFRHWRSIKGARWIIIGASLLIFVVGWAFSVTMEIFHGLGIVSTKALHLVSNLIFGLGIGYLFSLSLLLYVAFWLRETLESRRNKANELVRVTREKEEILKKQNIRLEEEVNARTMELNASIENLEAAQEQLKVQAEKLRELDEIKTRVYTNITHEFRTPLTVISGMTEMIDGHHQAKKLIRANADQLLNLVNQLLELRKLQSGKLQLQPVCADIVHYLRSVSGSFRSIAERKGLEFRFFSDTEKLEMDFDPEKVLRIVSNLLSNAIKFTPEGGLVSLQLVPKKEDGVITGVSIMVQDSGIGIPPEMQNTIFERFFQVDQGTTRTGEGTGIGLSLCKELADLMGGEIRLDSTPDRGSTFEVILPVTRNAEKSDMRSMKGLQAKLALMGSEVRTTNSTGTEEIPAGDDQSVALVVEDNEDVVHLIKACIDPFYKVHVARDGREGIEKAIELVPDILISDVMMPHADGFTLCDTLKNDPRTSHIPIILLTALSEVQSRIDGLKRGADAYIAKPFRKEELLVQMENLLKSRKALKDRYASMEFSPTKDAGLQIEDAFMVKLMDTIDEHLQNPAFSVELLSDLMGVSRTQLHRKLSALSGLSATMTIRQARIRKAKELLPDPNLNVSEVAYDVGFSDPNYFSRIFKKEVGMSPSEYVERMAASR